MYLALFEDSSEDLEYDDDDDDDDDWDYVFEEPEPIEKGSAGRKKTKGALREILEKMNKEDLVALLVELSGKFPEIEREMLEKEQLATGQVASLVNSLLREIRALTSEPVWSDHWGGEFSRLLASLGAVSGAARQGIRRRSVPTWRGALDLGKRAGGRVPR